MERALIPLAKPIKNFSIVSNFKKMDLSNVTVQMKLNLKYLAQKNQFLFERDQLTLIFSLIF